MSEPGSLYAATQIEPDDAVSGFTCGNHPHRMFLPIATAKAAFADP